MQVGFWNIKGLNSPLKQKEISKLLCKFRIQLFGIIECKLQAPKLDFIMRQRFKGWSQVNNLHLAHPGRITVIWNSSSVSVQLLHIHQQYVHVLVQSKETREEFIFTFIYGLHNPIARRSLWTALTSLAPTITLPWMLLGDFNNVLYSTERANGSPVTSYETQDFLQLVTSLGLADISSSGALFTWSNGKVWSKLDRVMINNRWNSTAHAPHALFLPLQLMSDHSPCITSIGSPEKIGKANFKFFDMWLSHPSFAGVLQQMWSVSWYGTQQFQLCKKLKSLKAPLRELNSKFFSNITVRNNEAQQALATAVSLLHDCPEDIHLQEQVKALRQSAHFLNVAETRFLAQKAKCRYLNQCDRNNKFFHAILKRNARNHFIPMLLKDDGHPTSSVSEVITEFTTFYHELLGSEINVDPIDEDIMQYGPKLSSSQAVQLIQPVTTTEIKNAVNSIADDRAPGPDGYTAGFFKKSWDTVGVLVSNAVQEFFVTGQLLKQINHTLITLVPKSTHANTVRDFRPISCCNVVYKIIAKILAHRIAEVLPSVINAAQSGFIRNRHLADNVHLAQELVKGYNRKRISPRCTLNIDLRRAYDYMNWNFIRSVMHNLAFPAKLIGWIMTCVSSVSFSLRINGSVHAFFKGKRGLRQGDPLSPYIFVIGLEYLSRLLAVHSRLHPFRFHPKCANLGITHLAYADDLLLFCRGDIPSVQMLMTCLQLFHRSAGLSVNLHKSQIYMAGIPPGDQAEIISLTNLSCGQLPVRYLGIPLASEGLKVVQYGPLLEQLSTAIGLWSPTTLTHAGRLALIKSVLQGTQCFWLSILPIPSTVMDKLIALCRGFLWAGQKPLVAWKDLQIPINEGGLGIRDTRAWNKALLSKVIWHIQQKQDTLWVRWLHHYYLRGVSIWELPQHREQSVLLRHLLDIRDILVLKTGSALAAAELLGTWSVSSFTHTAYDFFRVQNSKCSWAGLIWTSYIPPKYSFTTWLALRGRLLTKDRLEFLDVQPKCALCDNGDETISHLFFSCHFSSNVWQQIKRWCGLSRQMGTLRAAIKWLQRSGGGSSWLCKKSRLAFVCTVYYIWITRNRLYFEQLTPDVDTIVYRIKTHVYMVGYSLYPGISILH